MKLKSGHQIKVMAIVNAIRRPVLRHEPPLDYYTIEDETSLPHNVPEAKSCSER